MSRKGPLSVPTQLLSALHPVPRERESARYLKIQRTDFPPIAQLFPFPGLLEARTGCPGVRYDGERSVRWG